MIGLVLDGLEILDEELIRELIRMFNDGETTNRTRKKGRLKYTAPGARKELSETKLVSGLMKFTNMSKYGNLPTPGQLTSF